MQNFTNYHDISWLSVRIVKCPGKFFNYPGKSWNVDHAWLYEPCLLLSNGNRISDNAFTDEEEEEEELSRARVATSRQTVIEVKVPREATGAIIGAQGSRIKLVIIPIYKFGSCSLCTPLKLEIWKFHVNICVKIYIPLNLTRYDPVAHLYQM